MCLFFLFLLIFQNCKQMAYHTKSFYKGTHFLLCISKIIVKKHFCEKNMRKHLVRLKFCSTFVPLFTKHYLGLSHGVMVALLVLVQSV